jgi:hypothetical protein
MCATFWEREECKDRGISISLVKWNIKQASKVRQNVAKNDGIKQALAALKADHLAGSFVDVGQAMDTIFGEGLESGFQFRT